MLPRRNKSLSFSLTTLLTIGFLSSANLSASDSNPTELKINIDKMIAKKNDGFFGINTLYWIDTNIAASKNDNIYSKRLKELGVQRLRFPAGTKAESYDWEIHKDSGEDDPTMNTMEFCRFKKKSEIKDATFVVNMRDAFRAPGNLEKNIEASIAKAARWVSYTNIENKKDCNIKEWEIGNENYFSVFTAVEYADLLKRYSDAMKAVDGSIRIGAIGPWDEHSHEISFLDRLAPTPRRQLRNGYDERFKLDKEDGKSIIEFAADLNKGFTAPEKILWWPTVAKRARGKFDFIVTHRYDVRRAKKDFDSTISLSEEVSNIRKMVKDQVGKDIPIIMTEWNMGKDVAAEKNVSAIEHALAIAEMMSHYLSSGLEGANYWPARLPGHPFTLLNTQGDKATSDSMEILSAGQVFQLFSQSTRGRIVESSIEDRKIDVLASTNNQKNELNIMLTNRRKSSQTIKLEKSFSAKKVKASALTDGKKDVINLKSVSIVPYKKGGFFFIDLPAFSVTSIKIE